jgi:hypothetical protein
MRPLIPFVALFLLSGPALAEWDCVVERHYKCAQADECERDEAKPRVTLNDDKLIYRSCLVDCEQGNVTMRRNFFGSTYRYVKADLSARIMMRSRSGEYSEHTMTADGTVTSVAFGACSWR